MTKAKCQKCGKEIVVAFDDANVGKSIVLDVSHPVWFYAPRPVDGGFRCWMQKTPDPSKLMAVQHVCEPRGVASDDRQQHRTPRP